MKKITVQGCLFETREYIDIVLVSVLIQLVLDTLQIKNITMKNQSQLYANLYVCELEEPTPLIHGFLYPIHNGLILLIIWISFKVQKAVFKTLDRLGSRHINTIIKTNMVMT